ncbi:S8 family peptidase [Garciella nitratireducens]|uniref:Serine protease AprX n=1 Tax=Garciella nitratireducens DSM 15102 TaxID=1121911 RepID=A0A1T4PI47_9FIRM|nr:S8 family peptidase [Garciella nitratireducens]RBP37600.1 serine protease AprX [Garciella nitratireducens]SJZ91225.1 serine protease AprX [Garciella nitratireducens DSM 15102]
MPFFLPFLFLLICSSTVSAKFIDKRVQTKIKVAKQEDYTSVIVLSKDLKDKKLEEEIQKYHAKIKYKLDIIKAYALEIPCKCIEKLAILPQVDFIADDATSTTLMDVARSTVGGLKAEQFGLTGNGVGIAIIDTGVYPHTDLVLEKNRIIAFKDFVNNKKFPYDDNGHGTHVAGIAAGNGYMSKKRYQGMAPKANIIGVKVMDKNGSGSTSDIIAGMQWVLKNKDLYNIRVVSLSLGSDPDLLEREDPLVKGVEALWNAGIVVVAAAGNEGPKSKTINSPGISRKIITVGASDDHSTIDTIDDTIANFSSRGPTKEKIVKPDIVAPGVEIQSLATDIQFIPEDNVTKYKFKVMKKPYTEKSGTSMATPIVSGAIALLLEKEPRLTPDEVKTRLLSTASPIKNANQYDQGKGQMNLERMLQKD